MEKFSKAISCIENIFLGVSGGLLIVMMLITASDTIARKVLERPIPGTLEFMEEIGMIAIVFLPMSYVYFIGGNVKVELFERFFSRKLKRAFAVFNAIVSVLLFVVLMYASWISVSGAIEFHSLSNSVWKYPLAPSYAMVTIGAVLTILRTVQNLILELQGKSFESLRGGKI